MKTLYLTRHQQININEILYLQGDSNYTFIHSVNKPTTIASKTLHLIHSSIDYESFIRISKNLILNIDYISTYDIEDKRLSLILYNGQQFTVSRRRFKSCLDKIGVFRAIKIQKKAHSAA
ncbi:hypothetical protein EMA8858_01797 [Emticicia aquatica]|uniref:HTH LytTR-type domain-containing protein n=1 Tax=Emticicia aquatica TaxID=1681835 RepID=A0ABN8ERY6_9BACT|nr:LytTR family DNA-binding domain-containing protein [Emticicia aquatica]CAH0995672.1 hypothetical protein EMA8858_01797 [Emticicia aquatica]